MKITTWQKSVLTIEQNVMIAQENAIIEEIMPIIKAHIKNTSLAPIIARLITTNEFSKDSVSVQAFSKPYIKQDVILIKINKGE